MLVRPMKPPDKLERRDVEEGLLRSCLCLQAKKVLQQIDEARLDRLIRENLDEQKRLAEQSAAATGAAFLEHQRKWDLTRKRYESLMKERFETR